ETVVGVLVQDGQGGVDLTAVQGAVEASLASFKRPRKLIVVDALPRNTMGKVQKNLLRDEYSDLFS
ncbi:MAG: malonyl-CoA synthase, partial [Marinosulfonomonas sp.]|nr:malonyl-CoA synthase [Marinosulfonomonas sp.]